MLLAIFVIALTALTALLAWCAADRWWHYAVVALGAVALFPLVARSLTGDVSHYLPEATFSDSPQGKEQIILASAFATIAVAVMAVSVLFWVLRVVVQRAMRPAANR
jgi:hypothetical protein